MDSAPSVETLGYTPGIHLEDAQSQHPSPATPSEVPKPPASEGKVPAPATPVAAVAGPTPGTPKAESTVPGSPVACATTKPTGGNGGKSPTYWKLLAFSIAACIYIYMHICSLL